MEETRHNLTSDATTRMAGELTSEQLADLQRFCANTAISRAGIKLLAAAPARCSASLPVAGNTQPLGLLHGGATALLVETVASIAAYLYAQPDQVAVGTELSISHLRSVRHGNVIATAEAIHLGRTSAVYAVMVRDEREQLIAQARVRCQICAPR